MGYDVTGPRPTKPPDAAHVGERPDQPVVLRDPLNTMGSPA